MLHHCDNPACCEALNADHLFLGTKLDNNHDRDTKQRQAKGEYHGRSKLTIDDVLEIRRIYVKSSHEFGGVALAQRFGVCAALINFIIHREIWTHID